MLRDMEVNPKQIELKSAQMRIAIAENRTAPTIPSEIYRNVRNSIEDAKLGISHFLGTDYSQVKNEYFCRKLPQIEL